MSGRVKSLRLLRNKVVGRLGRVSGAGKHRQIGGGLRSYVGRPGDSLACGAGEEGESQCQAAKAVSLPSPSHLPPLGPSSQVHPAANSHQSPQSQQTCLCEQGQRAAFSLLENR